jgi:signal transduction histidine kinase
LGISAVLLALTVYIGWNLPASVPAAQRPGPDNNAFLLLALAFSMLGAYLASRRETNRVAWIACTIGLAISLSGFGRYYPLLARHSPPGRFPGGTIALLAGDLGWSVALGVMLNYLPLLFPDGRLVSARWRPWLWLATIGLLVEVLGSWITELGSKAMGDALQAVSALMLLGTVIAAFASILVRYRRAGSLERLQLKWFLASIALVGLFIVLQTILVAVGAPPLPFNDLVVALILLAIPASIAIAVLKYRLYDIDLVISRALVYTTLAVFITVVYVGIVVGIGALLGSGGRLNVGLSVLATAIVAVVFQPIRQRVEAFANRLVFGSRSTPYETLAQLSHQVANAYADDEVLLQLARVLAEGTAAEAAAVWIETPDGPVSAARWPETRPPLKPTQADRVAMVRHHDELLGTLTIKKRPGEPVNPIEQTLLDDLAAQAGQVLRNVQLTADLQARLLQISEQAAELQASRQRIVATQDDERRRLERNIHDGAQQHLVALAVKLRLAATFAKRDPEKALRVVRELENQTEQALQTLRDLAQGIYPAALREHGLAEALRPHALVQADGVGRYDPEVEAAAYFCCLEAVQNAAKHAKASRVVIKLRDRGGELLFSVADDGAGFDTDHAGVGVGLQNMKDRIASVGGSVHVESRRGVGTTVSGAIPIRDRAASLVPA